MKKLSLMLVGAVLAWQTSAIAQTTTPAKTSTQKTVTSKKGAKKSKKATSNQTPDNQNGLQYSTSDRSGLNSYSSATDTAALGSGTGDQTQQNATTSKTKTKKGSKKSTPAKVKTN